MKAVVTGAAGFIGSHLSEELLKQGHTVIGVDALTDNYDATIKRRNLAKISSDTCFEFLECDVSSNQVYDAIQHAGVVFHLAAQPGVRSSWGGDFKNHLARNLAATQAFLEMAASAQVGKLVLASSSSVYGNAISYPTSEEALPKPISPYGVTKLAQEHLCFVYGKNFDIPVIALRLFTVYGPRQRPDMAFNRFIDAISKRWPITLYGDGNQTRDFTFVSDVVSAMMSSAVSDTDSRVINVGGGGQVKLLDVLDELQAIMGVRVTVNRQPAQPGDAKDTGADISLAKQLFGYVPSTSFTDGLTKQVNWQLDSSESNLNEAMTT